MGNLTSVIGTAGAVIVILLILFCLCKCCCCDGDSPVSNVFPEIGDGD
jgi:hypothetical protein